MTRIHQAAAWLFCLLPLAGLASGGGGPTFSMYASSRWFRFDIIARDGEGRAYEVAPTALASRATSSARPFLAGGDHFRRTYDTSALRRHVGDFGRLACEIERGRAVSIDIALIDGTGSSTAINQTRETRETVSCFR